MPLKIRLARGGAKKRPHYSIVVADSRSPRDGRFIEKIGTYDPMLDRENPKRVTLQEERARYWVSQGAQPTDRTGIILGRAGIIPMPEPRNNPQQAQPKAKAQERAKRDAAAAGEGAAG